MSNSSNKYIDQNRITCSFSKIVKEMDVTASAELFSDFLLEQDILSINEKNVNEIFEKIPKNAANYFFIAYFIEYSIKIRPKQKDSLFSLLAKIPKGIGYTPSHPIMVEYKDIIVQKGVLDEIPSDYQYGYNNKLF